MEERRRTEEKGQIIGTERPHYIVILCHGHGHGWTLVLSFPASMFFILYAFVLVFGLLNVPNGNITLNKIMLES